MQFSKLLAGLVVCISLAGCQWNDVQRAGIGAATGAVVSKATSGDLLTGAIIGAGAGALCDDFGANICN